MQFSLSRSLLFIDARRAAAAACGGVQVLEAALRLGLTPADALRTRLRLADVLLALGSNTAQAEAHVQKAVLLVQAAASSVNLKSSLAATHVSLLLNLNPPNIKQAKSVLKQAALETQQTMRTGNLDAAKWFFYFISQRVDLLLMDHDSKAAHQVLSSAANSDDSPVLVKATFLLRRLLLCISSRDHSLATSLVKNYLDPLWASSNLEFLNPTYLIAKVLISMQTGDRKTAKLHLDELCHVVLGSTGDIDVMVLDVNSSKRDDLVIPDLLSKNQQMAIVCLIAGSVLRDSETSRAIDYLKRGSMIVQDSIQQGPDSSDESIQDVIESRKWLVEFNLICLHQLVEAYILKGDLQSAEETILSLIDTLHSTTSSTTLINKYLPTVLLDWGLIHQANGRLREASRCYFGAAAVAVEVAKQEGNVTVTALVHEIRILASFCNVVVLMGSGEPGRVEMAKQILEELGKDVQEAIIVVNSHGNSGNSGTPTTPSSTTTTGTSAMAECDHVKAFLSLCSAMVAHKNGEIKKTKQVSFNELSP
ncbi:UNVERIFIED_CONTAM: hypothetical protein HDU68_005002 [Siphonaria sp. JEL0065]|nr:hypothetical protein HDU68_005002 [Siphonaria sp. JEL0065]